MTDEARSTKERGTQKNRIDGNRWIEGVRQNERQGWKGGIKSGGVVSIRRRIEKDYFERRCCCTVSAQA